MVSFNKSWGPFLIYVVELAIRSQDKFIGPSLLKSIANVKIFDLDCPFVLDMIFADGEVVKLCFLKMKENKYLSGKTKIRRADFQDLNPIEDINKFSLCLYDL